MKRYCYILLLLCSAFLQADHVGLLVVATGRYIHFVEPLLQSADRHFLPNQDVTYFVFTDQNIDFYDRVARPIVRIEQQRLGWPYDTMMRLAMYHVHADAYEAVDYLYACDADMLFVDTVGDEILGTLVATQHPGFVGKRGSYETRPASNAYVAPHEGERYYAGGFNGGKKEAFLALAQTVAHNVEKDLDQQIVAVWHDESHINRYFIDNVPDVMLSPSYCYPESWQLPYHKRLLALDKNHSEMRA